MEANAQVRRGVLVAHEEPTVCGARSGHRVHERPHVLAQHGIGDRAIDVELRVQPRGAGKEGARRRRCNGRGRHGARLAVATSYERDHHLVRERTFRSGRGVRPESLADHRHRALAHQRQRSLDARHIVEIDGQHVVRLDEEHLPLPSEATAQRLHRCECGRTACRAERCEVRRGEPPGHRREHLALGHQAREEALRRERPPVPYGVRVALPADHPEEAIECKVPGQTGHVRGGQAWEHAAGRGAVTRARRARPPPTRRDRRSGSGVPAARSIARDTESRSRPTTAAPRAGWRAHRGGA